VHSQDNKGIRLDILQRIPKTLLCAIFLFVKKNWEVQHSHWSRILSVLHTSAALAALEKYVAAQ